MIIGLVGNKRVGKDSCADYLCYTHNFKKFSFATYLKQSLKILFDWDDSHFNDDNKEKVDTYWDITPRQMCQDLGSFLRNFNKNFHINRLDKDIKKLNNANIVFSDIRYQNELDYVKSLGGIIIKIDRNTVKNEFSNHESETSIDNLNGIDSYIINNLSLDILYKNINNIILLHNNKNC
jgi:hypothetical protein